VASEDTAVMQRFDPRPPHAPQVTSFHCRSCSCPFSAFTGAGSGGPTL